MTAISHQGAEPCMETYTHGDFQGPVWTGREGTQRTGAGSGPALRKGEEPAVRRDTCNSLQDPEPAVSVGHRPRHPARDRVHRSRRWERAGGCRVCRGWRTEVGGRRSEPISMPSEKGDVRSHLSPGLLSVPRAHFGTLGADWLFHTRGRGSLASAELLGEEDVFFFPLATCGIQGT